MESKNPDENGRIRIQTGEEDGKISIKITDSGAGISDESLDKMFDPFFTTKGLGKGTGLGLSIVSGIVKKHNGEISVESIPGETTFTVSLPVDNGNGGTSNEQ
jgi:signal transduction histidine kinase